MPNQPEYRGDKSKETASAMLHAGDDTQVMGGNATNKPRGRDELRTEGMAGNSAVATNQERPSGAEGWLGKLPASVKLFWCAWARMGEAHGGLLAAGVAFYGLLSVFPGITAAVALFGLFADPTLITEQSTWLTSLLPSSAAELVNKQLVQVAGARPDTLGWAAAASAALALWSASRSTDSVIQGLNVIFGTTEQRSFIVLKLVTVTITLAAICGALLLLLIVAAIPAAVALFGDSALLAGVTQLLRWPLMFVVGIAGISLLYRFGPDRSGEGWKLFTPGAILSCALWVAGSIGFSLYVQAFGSYNETFGALSGVIILLTWMWLSAFVILFGAGLDAERRADTMADCAPLSAEAESGAEVGDSRSSSAAA
ncbi:putative ribonuclease BN [Phaeobacter piscinae]|uniref:Ribonuclease BN n=2 Tax=Phaeobacter piscinae TaxID=1580596 RepID=A0ABM6P9H8_9RHOB|nr:putative ribonuclease BN [Phaeobacter piscinae]AUQ84852.1 putative ribonuclease BN [Phaeobacter piscinae]AUR22735.1 putative ribonuclease BN [Phaeobacter piscinae]